MIATPRVARTRGGPFGWRTGHTLVKNGTLARIPAFASLPMSTQRLPDWIRQVDQQNIRGKRRSPEREEEFRVFINEVTAGACQAAAITALSLIAVTWPLDAFLYADDPAHMSFSLRWHSGVVLLCAALYLGPKRVPAIRAHSAPWAMLLFALATVLIGYEAGRLGGLETPWFYSSYILPFLTVLLGMPLGRRVLFTLALGGLFVGFYFLPHPEHATHPFVAMPVLILFCVCICAVVIGQIIHNLYRTSFFQRRALTERTRSLETLDQAKSAFFANVNHELRTPLTLILGSLRMLQRRANDPQDRSTIATGLRNAARLLVLINQLLDLAKLERGPLTVRKRSVDLAALIREVLGNFESAEGGRAWILQNVDDSLLAEVDPKHVRHLLYNLFSNAVKFTDSEKGKIRVSLDADHRTVRITVADNGVGIPKSRIKHVFDRFTQVDSGRHRKHGGTGIGLALVSEIVQAHEGTIELSSEVGIGSTFTVTLPRGKPAAHPDTETDADDAQLLSHLLKGDAPSPEPRPAAHPSPAPGPRPRIVLVDDNADLRQYLADLLTPEFDVDLAPDGRRGVTRCLETRPDLLITDMMMPEMSGREVVEELRRHEATRALPVLVLTARSDADARVEALECGADDYLSKPFEETELQVRVRNLIRSRQQELELARVNAELTQRVGELKTLLGRSRTLEQLVPGPVVDGLLSGSLEAFGSADRREVSFLLTDLVGLAEEGRNIEPERAALILSDYLGEIAKTVQEHQGLLANQLDTQLLVLFGALDGGAPAAHPRQAVMAALEMRDRVDEISRHWRERGVARHLRLKASIVTGFASVGFFGGAALRRYGAVSPSLHVGRDLLRLARGGQVLCGFATKAHIGAELEARDLGRKTMPSTGKPVEVFELGEARSLAVEDEVPDDSLPHDSTVRLAGEGMRLGPYRIVGRLGRGGMGEVYRAYDEALDRTVAVKVLSPNLPKKKGFLDRFQKEGRVLARLDSEHIVHIYFVGQDHGRPYFAMELVSGGSLQDRLRRSGHLSPADCANVILQTARGLDAAHRRGIIHRDIKPDNLLFTDEGKVKITDFGLGKMIDGDSEEITGDGWVVGTPRYMAPEQCKGQKADFRSDVYSLGITLYECLFGHPPFGGTSLAVLAAQHLTSPVPVPDEVGSRVPRFLWRIVRRMLEKDPADRYPSYEALIEDLTSGGRAAAREIQAGMPTPAVG